MNNDGMINPELEPKPDDHLETRRSPVLFVALAGVMAISLVIGVQAFGILYSIAFPPKPPLPDNVIEIRHDNIDYGVDDWLYRTSSDACDIARFYQANGGECRMVANQCDGETATATSTSRSSQQVAFCTGEESFSLFAYRWEANIATGYRFEDGQTQFNLIREVFWTGAVPPRLDPRQGLEFND